MVPRLFLGNFDFEHRLAQPSREIPTKLRQLNAEMASVWLSIADDGDFLWTPEPIDPEFFRTGSESGFPNVVPIESLAKLPVQVECIPWGWSADVRQLAKQLGWTVNAPSDQSVRQANSRATSHELEQRWNVGLNGSHRIETLDDFKLATSTNLNSGSGWVVKAEFGMSARERILGKGSPNAADENWVLRRLASHDAVFFEPWVDRIDEVGIQIDVPQTGKPRLIGLTPMLVDDRGQYAGSWLAYHETRFPAQRTFWLEAIEVALRAAAHLQSFDYFGPLGIDAMCYRDHDGSVRLRPLQDINARWTMGRLSLGWRRLLEPDDEACWQHSSSQRIFAPTPLNPAQIVNTSPDKVRGLPCQHMSRLLIQRPPATPGTSRSSVLD